MGGGADGRGRTARRKKSATLAATMYAAGTGDAA
jgi:hypothetical protein